MNMIWKAVMMPLEVDAANSLLEDQQRQQQPTQTHQHLQLHQMHFHSFAGPLREIW